MTADTTFSALRGRCNSEPAVTVRDPTAAGGRLTRCDSGTDGESPDGRWHAAGSDRAPRWSVLRRAHACPAQGRADRVRAGGGGRGERS